MPLIPPVFIKRKTTLPYPVNAVLNIRKYPILLIT